SAHDVQRQAGVELRAQLVLGRRRRQIGGVGLQVHLKQRLRRAESKPPVAGTTLASILSCCSAMAMARATRSSASRFHTSTAGGAGALSRNTSPKNVTNSTGPTNTQKSA